MKKYKNKKTNAIILTDSILLGDWELVVDEHTKKKTKKE